MTQLTPLDIQFQERCIFLSPSLRMWVLVSDKFPQALTCLTVSQETELGQWGRSQASLGSEWEEVKDPQGACQDRSSE